MGTKETPLDDRQPLSLNIVYDEIKGQMAEQAAQIATLDGKASFILTSASLLTAGATGLQGTVAQHAGSSRWLIPLVVRANDAVHWLEVAALLVYLGVLVAAWNGYRVRVYHRVPDPKGIHEKYLFDEEDVTKRKLAATMVKSYVDDEKEVKKKVWWTQVAFIALGIEGFCLALMTFVQVLI